MPVLCTIQHPKPTHTKLDKIQNQALRVIAGASKGTSTKAIEVALGIMPLELRRKDLRINYYTKMSKDSSHPAHQAFDKNIGHKAIKDDRIPGGWKTMDEIEKVPN